MGTASSKGTSSIDKSTSKQNAQKAHPIQAKDRRPLTEISNCPPPEEEYPSTCPDEDAQRIANLELKRIDPTLRSRRSEHGDEDDTLSGCS
ncbi:hypothetical protein SO802_018371 [Lithocarpus litseifolius]|uniref:Uncharacterized protein n=1 Tax=Lithocarpus litseifolius TaxID=425828 RepID=A0AAW2CL64_9ROSI